MENEASKTRTLDVAFVADAELLRRLEVVLREVDAATLEYAVKFSDGSTVTYSDIEEVIAQPNSSRRSIVSVIAGAQGRAGRSAYVTLRDNPSPSVEYTVNGRQRDVIYFADKLDDLVAALSQWYSPFFSKLQIVPLVVVIALPLMAAGALAAHFPPNKPGPLSWIPGIGLLLVAAIEYWASKLFPRGTFAIGNGAKRHHLFDALRYGFVGSVVAGVVANWIYKHL